MTPPSSMAPPRGRPADPKTRGQKGRAGRGGREGSHKPQPHRPPPSSVPSSTQNQLARPAPPTIPLHAESVSSTTTYPDVYADTGAPSLSAHPPGSPEFVTKASTQRAVVSVTLPLVSLDNADAEGLDHSLILKEVESRFNVNIRLLEGNDAKVCITSTERIKVQQAITAIQETIGSQADEFDTWQAEILLDTLGVGKNQFQAHLDKAPAGCRPTSSVPSSEAAYEDEEARELADELQTSIRDRAFEMARGLQSSTKELRMRVHFGTLRLHEWKRGKETYSYDELQSLIRRVGCRGTFKLDELLGESQFNEDLLVKIRSSQDILEPLNPRVLDLEDVPPLHTLILRTTSIDLESEVMVVGSHETLDYRLGPVCGYRRGKGQRAFQILSSAPASRYDWSLEVRTRVNSGLLPFHRRDLEPKAKFKAPKQDSDFPQVSISKDFAARFKLEEVLGKTSWVFRIKGTPYQVEASVYHKWTNPSCSEPAEMGSGVTLRGASWDDELNPMNIEGDSRPWSDDFRELFPDGRGENSIALFLRCVNKIQGLLSEVADFQVV